MILLRLRLRLLLLLLVVVHHCSSSSSSSTRTLTSTLSSGPPAPAYVFLPSLFLSSNSKNVLRKNASTSTTTTAISSNPSTCASSVNTSPSPSATASSTSSSSSSLFDPAIPASVAPVIAVPTVSAATPTVSAVAWIDGIKSAVSSALAAACVKTLLQPLDAIKTYQQYTMTTSTNTNTNMNGVSLGEAMRAIFYGTAGGSTTTSGTISGGIGGSVANFYAGLGVTILGSMPSVGLYFGVYSYCKHRLVQHYCSSGDDNNDESSWKRTVCIALSAAIGNSVASVARVPYEVVKQRRQLLFASGVSSSTSSMSMRATLQSLFPKGGIASQIGRDVPYAVVTLLLYEALQARMRHTPKQTQQEENENTQRQLLLDFCIGGISGGISSWVTNPMDVIKTRLQTAATTASSNDRYQGSMWTCICALWREGGHHNPSVFFRGSVARLMHKVPANACFFLFYEGFRRLLRVSSTSTSSTTTSTPSTSTTTVTAATSFSSPCPAAAATTGDGNNKRRWTRE